MKTDDIKCPRERERVCIVHQKLRDLKDPLYASRIAMALYTLFWQECVS